MRKILEILAVFFLLAVLTGVCIGLAEVTYPGFAIFALGTMTGITLSAWFYLQKIHSIVVEGLSLLALKVFNGDNGQEGLVRNRGSTLDNKSNFFLSGFTPAKVSIFDDKVKSINYKITNKSDPVRSDAVFYGANTPEFHWLYSRNIEELQRYLAYCVQNKKPEGIKRALNALKTYYLDDYYCSHSRMGQIEAPNFQSNNARSGNLVEVPVRKSKIILC